MRSHRRLALLSGLLVAFGACGNSDPVSVTSTLTSASVTSAVIGQHGKIRLNFSNPLSGSVDVSLASSDDTVVHVSETATVPSGVVSADVQYDAVALGSAFLTIKYGDVSLTTSASVVDSFRPVSANGPRIEKGATGLMYVYANATMPEPFEISLTVSEPSIGAVPDKVVIPAFTSYAPVEVIGKVPGSTSITAAAGGHATTTVMYVVDHARLSSVSSYGMFEAGGTARLNLYLDASVAKSTTISVTSSNPAVAAAPMVVVPAGNSTLQFDVPILGAGITDLAFTLADSGSTWRIAAVDKARLRGLDLSSTIAVGLSGSLSVSLDAIVAAERNVTLSSSDPSVLAVPDHLVIPTNQQYASTTIAGLKEGDAVVTATLDGVVWKRPVHVGYTSSSISLQLRSNFAAVGAIDELSISLSGSNTAAQVMLTSSDPTVAAVPPSITVSGSTTVPLTALKVGHTDITATANGLTYTVGLQVVALPTINQFGPTFNVQPGESTSSYLYFNSLPPPGAKITFTSSDPTVMPAPADYYIVDNNTYSYFSLTGLKSGTAVLTASVSGGPPTSAIAYVGGESSPPSFYNSIGINASSLEVGAVTYAVVYMDHQVSDNVNVTFSTSAAGIVSLPQTMGTISAGAQQLYFPIVGMAAGTVDISATIGGIKKSTTVTVVAKPTFSISLGANVKAGEYMIGSVSANCVLAANNTFNLASSMTGFATVSAPTLTLAPGQQSPSANFVVTGVAAGMATITATHGADMLSQAVTVVP